MPWRPTFELAEWFPTSLVKRIKRALATKSE